MMGILRMILAFLRAFLASQADLAVENVMLRQQLLVLQRSVPRLKFRRTDRVVLCWLSRLWAGWKTALDPHLARHVELAPLHRDDFARPHRGS